MRKFKGQSLSSNKTRIISREHRPEADIALKKLRAPITSDIKGPKIQKIKINV